MAAGFHHYGNVNALVEQCTFEVVAGEIQKRHAHARRSFLKCCQRVWKNLCRRRRRITEAEFTLLTASQGPNSFQSFVGASKHGSGLTGKEFSGLGKLDSSRAALKEFQTKLRFEILNLTTQGRLGDVKSPRGLGHVAKLGDGYKIPQVTKFHTR